MKAKRFFCLFFVLIAFSEGVIPAMGQNKVAAPIEFLTPPKFSPAPRHQDDQPHSVQSLKKIKKRKTQARATREEPLKEKPKTWEEKLAENLVKDLATKRERRFLLELSFLAPFTATLGSKSGYSQNPTEQFQFLWRHKGADADGQSGIFTGLRLAAFSGTGFYKKEPGTFGILYIGPIFGWGRLDKPVADRGPNSSSSSLETGGGFLASVGLSMAHRQEAPDSTSENDLENDFAPRSIFFDSPGIWSELRWFNIYLGGLSFNPLVGFQSGQEKIIFYAGIGLGGWN